MYCKKKPKIFNVEKSAKVVDISWFFRIPHTTNEVPITVKTLRFLSNMVLYTYPMKEAEITSRLLDILITNHIKSKTSEIFHIKYAIPKYISCPMCGKPGKITCWCMIIQYCSKKCRQKHWVTHRSSCQVFRYDVYNIFHKLYDNCVENSCCDFCLQRDFKSLKKEIINNVFCINIDLHTNTVLENVYNLPKLDCHIDLKNNVKTFECFKIQTIYLWFSLLYTLSILYVSTKDKNVVRFVIQKRKYNSMDLCDKCYGIDCRDNKNCDLNIRFRHEIFVGVTRLRIQDDIQNLSFFYFNSNKKNKKLKNVCDHKIFQTEPLFNNAFNTSDQVQYEYCEKDLLSKIKNIQLD